MEQNNRTRQLMLDLLVVRHDRLSYELPKAEDREAKEGAVLELRSIVKKILDSK